MNYYQGYHGSHRIGPSKTPLVIKSIAFITLIISLICAFTSPFFSKNYLAYFLGLSVDGIKNYYFWQFITYNFIEVSYGITLGYIFSLFFNLYLIWVIGSFIVERTSQVKFLIFFLSCIIVSGLSAFLAMNISNKNIIFTGSNIGLLSILVSWMMFCAKDAKVFLFFVLPIKVQWIVLGLIFLTLISNISNMQMIYLSANLSACIFSYLYSVIIFNRFSLFESLNKLERFLINLKMKFLEIFKKKKY
jgi:membrane associated rhomboid family serine protease